MDTLSLEADRIHSKHRHKGGSVNGEDLLLRASRGERECCARPRLSDTERAYSSNYTPEFSAVHAEIREHRRE